MRVIRNISSKIYNDAEGLEGFSFYHTKNWHKFLKNTFGWEVNALIKFESGKLVFFLPFVSKYRLNFKKVNICLPFSHNVGPAYDVGFDISGIEKEAIPINNLEVHSEVENDSFEKVIDNNVVILDLQNFSTKKDLFKIFNKSSIQRKIKKGERQGFETKQVKNRKGFSIFYEMELETRHRQGSPIYPNPFFSNLHDFFENSNEVNLFITYLDNKPCAGLIFFSYRDVAIYAYGGAYDSIKMLRMGVNQVAMWSAIKHYYEDGKKIIDFGTTPVHHKNLLNYKLKWGGKKVPLRYSYFSKNANTSLGQINRQGWVTILLGKILGNLPKPIFKKISPFLLKLAI